MNIENYLPISIDDSTPDNRTLIMPHQAEAVKAMTSYFQLDKRKENRSGLVVMPTGSGKTYTAVNWLLNDAVVKGYRVIWLVHRQELVEQTFMEFRKQAPTLKGTGVKKLRIIPVSGMHLGMNMACRADVNVCSIASVANKYGYRFIERMLGVPGKNKCVVVIDEAHHVVSASYRKVITRIQKLNPSMVLLGLTATPTRMNQSELQRLQSIFNINKNLANKIGYRGYVYEVTLKQLLMSGFLAQPRYQSVKTEINGEVEFNLTEGDKLFFEQFGELSERLKDQIAKSSARNKLIVKQYLDNKDIYGKTIVFAVNQMHAETLCNEFKNAGVACDFAVSSRKDAQQVIRNFKENKFNVLINVQILTEGSDVPDIHTVFLTRETNSESLLMQMIGRGLRGEKAGGTKDAYIVAFHDIWDSFMTFMNPRDLDIFEDLPEEYNQDEPNEVIEIAPNNPDVEAENAEKESSGETSEEKISVRDIYLKLYARVRTSILSKKDVLTFPVGWFSVTDKNNSDYSLLVYEGQEDVYKTIENNIKLLNKVDPEMLLELYFADCEVKPELEEIGDFLDYIIETGEMPPYFTFEERSILDPDIVAKDLVEKFGNKATEAPGLEYIEKVFYENKILQQVYKFFFAYRKSVFDCIKPQKDAIIVTKDIIREKYEIVDNYFNLQALLDEVLEMYPKLSADGLVKLGWSKNVVRNWFALCQKDKTGTYYQIHINKILSSPKVDKEVIKYLLFHELLHQNGYWNHDIEFRKREWQYPNSAELDGRLDGLWLEYDMEGLYKDSVANEIPDFALNVEDVGNESCTAGNEDKTADDKKYDKNAAGIQDGYQYCMNCGYKLPITANFCKICGTKC